MNMLDEVVVMALVMFVVSFVRKWLLKFYSQEKITQFFLPVLVLVLAVLFNVLNVYFFGGGEGLTAAIAKGITLGVYSSGIYGLGKAALGKS